MNIDFKKLLPTFLRTTRWGQLIEAYQSIVTNDITDDKIKPISNQYNFEEMTNTEKINLCSIFGYDLLQYEGYTGSDEYLNKDLGTLVQRILWKNTQRGYQYLFYNFNAKGSALPTIYDSDDDFWQPTYEGASFTSTSPALLDQDLYLDSTDDEFLTLDTDVTISSLISRVMVLAIEFLKIEDTTQFLSANSLLVFKNQANQLKRATERFIYEPYLTVYMNPDATIYRYEYDTYDNSDSTYLESILLSGSAVDYTNIYELQVGNGSHEIVSGMVISGVDNLVESFTSGQLQEVPTTNALTSELRKKLYSSDRDQSDFRELALIDSNGSCFFYSRFPYIRYPIDYQHGFRLQFSVYQTYIITFNSTGGTAISYQRVRPGDTITQPTAPTRSTYSFVAWYTEETCENEWIFTDGIIGAMTLYAKWIKTYVFAFDSQGGSAIDSQIVLSGQSAIEPTDPTKDTYTFDDWYESVSYATVWDFETIVSGNTTVYSQWLHSVNFDTQGGLPELNVAPDYYGTTQYITQSGTASNPYGEDGI